MISLNETDLPLYPPDFGRPLGAQKICPCPDLVEGALAWRLVKPDGEASENANCSRSGGINKF
jgi:hypothetical protein